MWAEPEFVVRSQAQQQSALRSMHWRPTTLRAPLPSKLNAHPRTVW